MQIPEKLKTNRAFVKKAFNFVKYYPLTREDPLQMLLETLNRLEKLVDSSKDVSRLEPLSKKAQSIGNYLKPEELFQIEVIGEKNRFIIYRPTKFFKTEESEKIAFVYDLIHVPKEN